ncbi:MAG TPA: AF1514 family protein [Thiobacillus sp.]
MKNVHIDYQGARPDFQRATLLAKGIAMENQMQQPTIISWHQQSNQHMSPYYEGANPDSWWEKYGEGNGGGLEVQVGDEYGFVMMDAQDYETLGEMPLRNLSDASGNQYLCFTPILGRSNTPNPEACTYLDGWLADQL